jgi:simple sugar transport system substrate-binding protein
LKGKAHIMIHKKPIAAMAVSLAVTVALTACSSSGGKETTDPASNAGKANTPKMTIAMITHQAPGDTFWDIVRKGAEAGAAKDNVDLQYTNDPDPAKQSQLIQAAIDKKVDGIAVTDPNTGALGGAIKAAVAAGIPVSMLNAGADDAMSLGTIGYFGQDEAIAGQSVGERVVAAGGRNVLCVIQEQGNSALEKRCDGVTKGAGAGAKVQRQYVNGQDNAAVTTSIQAKLTQDKSIDWVVTLAAPIALDAVKAVSGGKSQAKIGTFDTNKELVAAVKDGSIQWAIDQQPYLQGYLALDSLWLYNTNGNTLGGGKNVATGPAFIDKANIDAVAKFAANGTR